MTIEEQIVSLKNIIYHQLKSIISKKVALFGLPSHGNIGDTLITIGELEFIHNINSKCIYKRLFIDDNPVLPELDTDCTILLQGGGDFGDIWRGIHEERLKIIKRYPNNNIIILPQSVFYQDINLLITDAKLLANHKKLTICARDTYSYDILSKYFNNNILLVPDMAFFIPSEKINKYRLPILKKHLYLKRIDKEFRVINDFTNKISENNYETSDWPTMYGKNKKIQFVNKLIGFAAAFRIRKLFFIEKIIHQFTMFYTTHFLYPYLMRIGIEFISRYEQLTLTRLHSSILAILLNKEFNLADNSYNKNSNFYKTWLPNIENCHFIN